MMEFIVKDAKESMQGNSDRRSSRLSLSRYSERRDSRLSMSRNLERRDSRLSMSRDYNDNSRSQALAASTLATYLRSAALKVHAIFPEDTVLEICEYGCATGGSSILPLKAIQDSTAGRPLRVIMNDLPDNSWDVLKETVEPEFPAIDFQYNPTSMYGPVSDHERPVHLAYSCFAQHWLSSGSPSGLPCGAMWANQLPRDNKYRTIWEEASKRDWEELLTIRAKEVTPGGMMVFHIQSSKCDGSLSENLAKTLHQAKLAMIEAKELSEEQAHSMVVPEFLKSPAEILAPLVKGPNTKFWDVENMEYYKMPCVYTDKLQDTDPSDEEDMFEEMILKADILEKTIASIRAFMDTSLAECVGKKKTDSFWKHVRKIVDGNPKKLSFDWMSTFITLRRLPEDATSGMLQTNHQWQEDEKEESL